MESVRQHNPLLAEAVDGMIDYVTERCPAAYPSRKQTEAVNAYLKSVHADGDGSMSTRNCEHRRIASMKSRYTASRHSAMWNLTDSSPSSTESHTTRSITCRKGAAASTDNHITTYT